MKLLRFIFFFLVSAVALLFAGFRVRPGSLRKSRLSRPVTTMPIPAGLPAPVERYIRASVGDSIPVVDSAIIWGHASIKRGPFWMPVRYWVAHEPGKQFRRYMEITWFGLPVVHGIDEFVEGHGMTSVAGQKLMGPKVDQASNLILWAEAVMMPALLFTDPRVRWEEIDANSARLVVPFEHSEDTLTVYFDAETGLIDKMTAMRYKGDGPKVPWTVEYIGWQLMNGGTFPGHIAIIWGDEGRPWSYWHFDSVDWNADLAAYLPEAAVAEPVPAAPVQPAVNANGKEMAFS